MGPSALLWPCVARHRRTVQGCKDSTRSKCLPLTLPVSGVTGQPAADAKAQLSGLLSDKQRLIRLLAGSAALVAAVVVGLMTPPGQRLLGRGEGAAMALMRQRTSLQPLTVAPEEFDEAVARQLVMTWQVGP